MHKCGERINMYSTWIGCEILDTRGDKKGRESYPQGKRENVRKDCGITS
jgi:hypothetical protein